MSWSSASARTAPRRVRSFGAGDVILALADHPVSDLADFYTRLWAQGPAGATIALRIQRDADVFDVEIRSADRAALLKKPRFN